MKKKILLPIGVDNFREGVRHRSDEGDRYTLVDKTMLIKAFIGSDAKISLITRPRRFGKTMNLSMLEHFFAPKVGDIATKGLFDGFKISQHPEAMKYQGQYQTIFLTLKSVKGEDFNTFYADLRQKIANLFKKHKHYVMRHPLEEEDKKLYTDITSKKAAQEEYAGALLFLSRLLYQASGKPVYILLDEYDTPIHDAYVEGYYKECTKFLAKMFNNTFKGNPYLAKAMITGILKVGKASLFSDLNNVTVYSMLDDECYHRFFGFTQAETDELLKKAGLPLNIPGLREMYNGYQINGTTLYNPWSMVNFVFEGAQEPIDRLSEAMRPYWVGTGGTHLLKNLLKKNLLEVEKDVTTLVQGGSIEIFIDEEVDFSPFEQKNREPFWSVMLLSGYLKVAKLPANHIFPLYRLTFPNQEIKHTFHRLAVQVASMGHLGMALLRGYGGLVQGHVDDFVTYVRAYLKDVVSYHDTGGQYKEQFAHGLILGMAGCLAENYTISSNRESGDGRYDIGIQPKDTTKMGVIIEIKVAPNGAQDLQKIAMASLEQITSKNYYQEMQTDGVKTVLGVGIAFYQKEVVIETRMV